MSEMSEVILDAAERRTRRAGFTALSFRDLAEDARIKSSSVHYYFRRKEDLGVTLVARYHEKFFAALAKASSNVKTPTDKLKAFCKVYRQALTGDKSICLCGMLGAESQGLPVAVRSSVNEFFNANIDWLADTMPTNLSRKVRRAKAKQIVATLQGAMMLATSLKTNQLFDDVVRNLIADYAIEF